MFETLPRIPTDVRSFEVRCKIGQFVMDGTDADRSPDLAAIGGTVEIAPDLRKPVRINTGDPLDTRVVGVNGLKFEIDPATGRLLHPDGQPGVELVDPSDPHLDPQDWTYTAVVTPAVGRQWSVTFGSPPDGAGIVNIGGLAGVDISPGSGANPVQQVVTARDETLALVATAEDAAERAGTSAEYAATVAYGQPLEVTDATVAQLAGDAGTATRLALTTGLTTSGTTPVGKGELIVNAADYLAADGVTDDAPSLAAMFAGLPSGARVLMPDQPILLNGIVTLPKRVTVTGGDLRATHSGPALWVRASGTVIDGTTIRGNGNATYDGNVAGIRANGTIDNPLTDIRILGVTIAGVQGSGLRLEYVQRSLVERATVDGFVYMGIQLSSAEDVKVDRCRVSNANHLTANSYGISVSDSLNTVESRSKHVTISRCTVEGIREWVGIETHGGYDIRVLDNTVLGCASGIAMVSGDVSRVCSAERVNVQGNYIDYAGALTQRGGLRLQGKPGALASGILRANTVVGYTSPTIFADYAEGRTDVTGNVTA